METLWVDVLSFKKCEFWWWFMLSWSGKAFLQGSRVPIFSLTCKIGNRSRCVYLFSKENEGQMWIVQVWLLVSQPASQWNPSNLLFLTKMPTGCLRRWSIARFESGRDVFLLGWPEGGCFRTLYFFSLRGNFSTSSSSHCWTVNWFATVTLNMFRTRGVMGDEKKLLFNFFWGQS